MFPRRDCVIESKDSDGIVGCDTSKEKAGSKPPLQCGRYDWVHDSGKFRGENGTFRRRGYMGRIMRYCESKDSVPNYDPVN